MSTPGVGNEKIRYHVGLYHVIFAYRFSLKVVILCGTMARQLEAARLLVPLADYFTELLSGNFISLKQFL